MRVADSNGQPIPGLFRHGSNGLVVDAPREYSKYLKEKERIEDIANLKTDVAEIKTMLSEILKAIHGVSNI
jgi:hypothetical protein